MESVCFIFPFLNDKKVRMLLRVSEDNVDLRVADLSNSLFVGRLFFPALQCSRLSYWM